MYKHHSLIKVHIWSTTNGKPIYAVYVYSDGNHADGDIFQSCLSKHYVDECINDLIELGLRVKVFEVDKYICWGTPNDLKTYEYWEQFHKTQNF